VIANWRLDYAIADNEPPAEELGKFLCDACTWTGVEEIATVLETIADAEDRFGRRARSSSSDSWLSCADSMARSLDAIIIFNNLPQKGTNNLCLSSRIESPTGGEKGINLIYGGLRLLESVGKRNEKGRWGDL
jgi:hypothetical protein